MLKLKLSWKLTVNQKAFHIDREETRKESSDVGDAHGVVDGEVQQSIAVN